MGFRVSIFVTENIFNKNLFYSTINAIKMPTINDKEFYKICWKSLLKTVKSTMNPTSNDKEFVKKNLLDSFLISLFATIIFNSSEFTVYKTKYLEF